MGVVYRADDLRLGRSVAIQFLTPGRDGVDAIERFEREARTASAINHPHICAVHDLGVHERIVLKALEKDRRLRYQTMADLLADLQRLRRDSSSGRVPAAARAGGAGRLAFAAFASLLVLGAASAVLWLWRAGRAPVTAAAGELQATRLTANPPDLPVTGAEIAADGRYLAYSDPLGIHVLTLATRDAQLLPNTRGFSVTGWSPDATRVRATRVENGVRTGPWEIALIGSSQPRLTDAGTPSADGRYEMAWRGDRELWIQEAGGANPRRLRAWDPATAQVRAAWEAEGHHVVLALTDHRDVPSTIVDRTRRRSPPRVSSGPR
jgi:hypothetical protein